jgi:magnesium chelatase subunit D
LIVFVLDSSGSMAAWQRMRQTKSALRALLGAARRRRDWVSLIAFRGGGTDVIVGPTPRLRMAESALESLPTGGTTPLAEGLARADQLARRWHRRRATQPAWIVLLTDGRGNVGSWDDVRVAARGLARQQGVVIDTEARPMLGEAAVLAAALGWRCLRLDEIGSARAGGAA